MQELSESPESKGLHGALRGEGAGEGLLGDGGPLSLSGLQSGGKRGKRVSPSPQPNIPAPPAPFPQCVPLLPLHSSAIAYSAGNSYMEQPLSNEAPPSQPPPSLSDSPPSVWAGGDKESMTKRLDALLDELSAPSIPFVQHLEKPLNELFLGEGDQIPGPREVVAKLEMQKLSGSIVKSWHPREIHLLHDGIEWKRERKGGKRAMSFSQVAGYSRSHVKGIQSIVIRFKQGTTKTSCTLGSKNVETVDELERILKVIDEGKGFAVK